MRDENAILARAGPDVEAVSIQGGIAGPCRRSRPETSRFNGATTADMCTPSTSWGSQAAAVDVFRVELASGGRILWKTLTPSDPVGVEDMRETLAITPDAESYCYTYMRRLGDLFVVDRAEVSRRHG